MGITLHQRACREGILALCEKSLRKEAVKKDYEFQYLHPTPHDLLSSIQEAKKRQCYVLHLEQGTTDTDSLAKLITLCMLRQRDAHIMSKMVSSL